MTPRDKTLALVGGIAAVMLIIAAVVYQGVRDGNVDRFIPFLVGFAVPTIASLLAAAGVKSDVGKLDDKVRDVRKQVNGNYSALLAENQRLTDLIAESADAATRRPTEPTPDEMTEPTPDEMTDVLPIYNGPTTGRHRAE